MAPRVCRVMSRSACSTVSLCPALSWTTRSPPTCAGSSSSSGNVRIGVSLPGLPAASPYRSSNRVEPTPTVTVSPSGTTFGPSVPESDGGAPMPTGAGGPPVVRNRARDGQRPHQVGELAAPFGGGVERDDRGLLLRRGQDAGLVRAVERRLRAAARSRPGPPPLRPGRGLGRAQGVTTRPAEGHAGHPGPDPGSQRPAQERPPPGLRGLRLLVILRHHCLRGSVMTAIGASSTSDWLAAASMSCRVAVGRAATAVQPWLVCVASISFCSRSSQVETAGRPV